MFQRRLINFQNLRPANKCTHCELRLWINRVVRREVLDEGKLILACEDSLDMGYSYI